MSDATDLASALIALSALTVSIVELRRSARDRRLSARPHLNFLRESSAEQRTFRLVMRNHGLGPAKVSAFSFVIRGTPRVCADESDIRPLLMASGLDSCSYNYFSHVTPGDFIPVGSEVVLMDLVDIRLDEGNKLSFEDTFSLINAQVKYESIYGERFVGSADLHPVALERNLRALKDVAR